MNVTKSIHRLWQSLLLAIAMTGNGLPLMAVDPPTMGWSSWNTYRVHISDSLIMKQADALMSTGLAGVGYCYVNIDDGYFGGRDAQGYLITHPQRFPHGLQPVVEHIHRLGLKAGIYSDAGRNTCGNYWDKDTLGTGVGFYGHDVQDARFFFDSLRFDFIKIDFCGGDAKQNTDHLGLSEQERYTAISQAIRATGRRDVRINICRWAFPGTWAAGVASSWRISPDINPSWGSVRDIILRNRYLSAYAGGGAYNDMDMLEIGRGLTPAEERTHFGMWCILSSPLLIGCDLTTIPAASLQLIRNADLIAINQDTLGLQAHVVRAENGVYLYTKDLEERGGLKRAVAVCNTTDAPRRFIFHPNDVLLNGQVSVYDVFEQKEVSNGFPEAMTLEVAPHDTRIFRLEGTARLLRTRYEAETAWLNRYQQLGMNPKLGYADYADDAGCSGGAKVTFLGNNTDNWLEWRDVIAPRAGKYRLRIVAAGDAAGRVSCLVNGHKVGHLDFEARQRTDELTVKLNAGTNVVRLEQPDGWAPDIDYMELVP